MTDNTEPMLQFFSYDHLSEPELSLTLQFRNVVLYIIDELPRNPERTVALRKLLEAKDCAVRSLLYK